MTPRIITWFLDAGPNGNPTGTSRDVYLKSVVTFFATSIRQNPGVSHQLFTDLRRLPLVDGRDIHSLLQGFGVEIVTLSHTYIPPADYSKSWQSQFYLMDILLSIGETVTESETVFILDSDCVWINPVDNMARAAKDLGVLAYDTDYPEKHSINGLSRLEMGEVFRTLDPSIDVAGDYVQAIAIP